MHRQRMGDELPVLVMLGMLIRMARFGLRQAIPILPQLWSKGGGRMSATDELRRMLDERGVKWEDDTPVPSMKPWKTSFTSFTGEEVSLGCYDEPKWIMGTLVFRTPEQAIAATLGELHEEIVRCRDCKYFLADELGEVCGLFDFEIIDGKMREGFCAWGKRRDGEQEVER